MPADRTSRLLAGWRRFRAVPWMRSATSRGPLSEGIAVLAYCRVVERPLRFVAAQVLHRGRRSVYRIRGGGPAICMRDGTPDLYSLAQVFDERHAQAPRLVSDALHALGRPLVVLDLGGNIGSWGARLAAALPVGRMTSLEPDPGNAEVLRCTIAANGRGGEWTVIEAAAGREEGEVAFAAGGFGRSRMEEGPGAIRVPARDVFALLDGVDLLKLDIEGGEWALIGDARFREIPCPVVSLEYHPHLRPGSDGAAAARAALERAGYEVVAEPGCGPDTGVLWGVR